MVATFLYVLALISNSISKSPKRNYNFSVLVPCFLLFYWFGYCENLAKCPPSKLFLIVLALIPFLNHSIGSFVAQVMPIFLWLVGFGVTQNSGHFLVTGSFCELTAGDFSNRLWSEFEFVFCMKVVGLCLSFLSV